MANSLKDKAIKGTLWSSLERFSVQGMQFIVMLYIARILDPKDYGLIGMLMIFIALSRSLTDSGFGQALIRKENNTDADRNTVFYFNLVVSCSLYVLLFAIAPLVADFYKEPQLVSVMRFYCLVIIIDSLAIIQRSILTYHIDFKTQMKASVSATVVSSVVALIMAYKGFGVWALVGQQLSSAVINTLTLWLYSKWRPSLQYSWQSFHELFSFGSKLMISGVINTKGIQCQKSGLLHPGAALFGVPLVEHHQCIAARHLSRALQDEGRHRTVAHQLSAHAPRVSLRRLPADVRDGRSRLPAG